MELVAVIFGLSLCILTKKSAFEANIILVLFERFTFSVLFYFILVISILIHHQDTLLLKSKQSQIWSVSAMRLAYEKCTQSHSKVKIW